MPEQYPVVQTDYEKVAVSADVAAGTVERLRTHWLAAVAADQKLAGKGEGLQLGFDCMNGRRLSHKASALISQVCAHKTGEGLLAQIHWYRVCHTEASCLCTGESQSRTTYSSYSSVLGASRTPVCNSFSSHKARKSSTTGLGAQSTLSGHVILRFMSVSEDKPLTRLLLGQTQI